MSSKKIIEILYLDECICKLAEKYNTTVVRICELNNVSNIMQFKTMKGKKIKIEVDSNVVQN